MRDGAVAPEPPATGTLLLTGARLLRSAPGTPSAPSTPGPAGRPQEDPADRPVDVLLAGGRVAAVGPDLATRSGVAAGAPRVALDGRTLMRGLHDAHVHMGQWALTRQRLDLSGARSAAEAVARVTDRLRERPPAPGSVLMGVGFRDALWPDVPTAALLDAGVRAAGLTDASVVLLSGDLHAAWFSTPALALVGRSGHPTGLLREEEWMPSMNALEHVPPDALDALVDSAARAAAARGVVAVVDFEIDDNVEAWRRRISAGTDALRVAASVWPEHLDAAVARGLATGDVVPGTAGLLTMGPLKVISDGSLNTRTAFCHDPYPGLEGTPGAHGVLTVTPDQLVPLMARATRHGIAAAIHAIGDRANTLALDAFAATGARGSVEHAQMLTGADVARFARLGVVASVQPEHALDDRDVADHHWAGRTGHAFPYGALLRAGATLALGSDAPVAPLEPWWAVAAAVHRSRDDRAPWHPEQAIPLASALDASTGGRARVREGDPADLVVLDADPFALDAAALRAMPVSGTLLGGRWTWCTLDR